MANIKGFFLSLTLVNNENKAIETIIHCGNGEVIGKRLYIIAKQQANSRVQCSLTLQFFFSSSSSFLPHSFMMSFKSLSLSTTFVFNIFFFSAAFLRTFQFFSYFAEWGSMTKFTHRNISVRCAFVVKWMKKKKHSPRSVTLSSTQQTSSKKKRVSERSVFIMGKLHLKSRTRKFNDRLMWSIYVCVCLCWQLFKYLLCLSQEEFF
jgi:hypothetical protein